MGDVSYLEGGEDPEMIQLFFDDEAFCDTGDELLARAEAAAAWVLERRRLKALAQLSGLDLLYDCAPLGLPQSSIFAAADGKVAAWLDHSTGERRPPASCTLRIDQDGFDQNN